jgi:hypothetical protein
VAVIQHVRLACSSSQLPVYRRHLMCWQATRKRRLYKTNEIDQTRIQKSGCHAWRKHRELR